jgi:hypothetical protein
MNAAHSFHDATPVSPAGGKSHGGRAYRGQVAAGARWLRPLVLPLGIGRLEITDAAGRAEAYDVGAHLDANYRVVGFRLVNDEDEGYDLFIDSGRWACSCPRFGVHGDKGVEGCAHAAGLRAALAARRPAALARAAL